MGWIGWGGERSQSLKKKATQTTPVIIPSLSLPPPRRAGPAPGPACTPGTQALSGVGGGGSARGTHTAPSSQQTFFLPHFSFCLPCFPIHLAAFLLTTTPPAPFFPPVRLLSPTLNNAEPKHSRTQPIYYNRSILYIRRIHTIFGSRGCSQGGGGGRLPPSADGNRINPASCRCHGHPKKKSFIRAGKMQIIPIT